MRRYALLLAAVVFAASCKHVPDVIYLPGPPVPEEAGTEEECAAMCATLERMQCPGWDGSPGPDEVHGTPDDVSCAVACVDIVSSHHTVTLNQRCVAAATDCEQVDACFGEE